MTGMNGFGLEVDSFFVGFRHEKECTTGERE